MMDHNQTCIKPIDFEVRRSDGHAALVAVRCSVGRGRESERGTIEGLVGDLPTQQSPGTPEPNRRG